MTDAEILSNILRIVSDMEALQKHEDSKPLAQRQNMLPQRAFAFEQIVRVLNGQGK